MGKAQLAPSEDSQLFQGVQARLFLSDPILLAYVPISVQTVGHSEPAGGEPARLVMSARDLLRIPHLLRC